MTGLPNYRPLLQATQRAAAQTSNPSLPGPADRAGLALSRSRALMAEASREVDDSPANRRAYEESVRLYRRAAQACAKYALHPAWR